MIITLIVKSKVTRKSREFIIAENVCQVCVLDLTADFGDNTKAKLTPDCQLRERAKLVFRDVCTQ